MIPKKAKDIIAEYAKDKNIPPEHIEIMVQEYWKTLRTTASSMEHWNLKIRGLGRITVSRKKVTKAFYNYLTEKSKCTEGTDSYTYQFLKKKIKLLANVIKIFRQEYKKKLETNKRKHEYLKVKYPSNGFEGKNKTSLGE